MVLTGVQQHRLASLIASKNPDQLRIPGLLWTRLTRPRHHLELRLGASHSGGHELIETELLQRVHDKRRIELGDASAQASGRPRGGRPRPPRKETGRAPSTQPRAASPDGGPYPRISSPLIGHGLCHSSR